MATQNHRHFLASCQFC